MRLFGLIGYPLTHSFSQKYFTEKFQRENISDAEYRNFPVERIEEVRSVFATENLCGFNVTIPYKQVIIPFLDELDSSANAIGAVNTVAIRNKKKIGYNTDAYGFENSLKNFLANPDSYREQKTQSEIKALVLGTGGSSKAVACVLKNIGIDFQFVSRTKTEGVISYVDLKPQTILEHKLIINTTPVGMFPEVLAAPAILYSFITSQHLLFDLIYNPAETEFLKRGKLQGTQSKNGLEMLQLQAEKSWEIWNR